MTATSTQTSSSTLTTQQMFDRVWHQSIVRRKGIDRAGLHSLQPSAGELFNLLGIERNPSGSTYPSAYLTSPSKQCRVVYRLEDLVDEWACGKTPLQLRKLQLLTLAEKFKLNAPVREVGLNRFRRIRSK